jgi:hypothetical protein
VFPSDLPGVNPATLNGMVLYYRLMTKWSGLGDSTELSRVGLSQLPISAPGRPRGWPPQCPLPMWTSGNGLLKRLLHKFFVMDVKGAHYKC